MNEPSEPGIHEGRMTGTADRPFEAGYATPMSDATSRLRELSNEGEWGRVLLGRVMQ